MWRIEVDERGARLVQGERWAQVLGATMAVVGVIGFIVLVFTGRAVLAAIVAFLMALPGVILHQVLGSRRERPIVAVVTSQAVPDGVLVTLTDHINKRHEITTDAETVRAILAAITK